MSGCRHSCSGATFWTGSDVGRWGQLKFGQLHGRRWLSVFGQWLEQKIHVESDDFLITVYQPEDPDEVERCVIALGRKPFSHGDHCPGRRFHFFDRNGVEYEIVSYA
jgi:hypothetical protein